MGEYAPLRLHVPEPPARPGRATDFSYLHVSPAGRRAGRRSTRGRRRPATSRGPGARARRRGPRVGPWDPQADPELLRRGMRAMLKTRAFDARMLTAQRQKKVSFYMQSLGEEAIAVGQTLALDPGDMCFPTYRQQGILVARGASLVEMMCQLFSNERDPMLGRQLPCSTRSASTASSRSPQPRAAVHPGGGVGHGRGDQGRHAASRRRGSATARRPSRTSTTRSPSLRSIARRHPQHRQQPVGDLVVPGPRRGEAATFAARGVGNGIVSLRADGNDLLAVLSASSWAAERARRNLGPTLIEWITYARARTRRRTILEVPARRRLGTLSAGRPGARLAQHLIGIGAWSEEEHARVQQGGRRRDRRRAAGGRGLRHARLRPRARCLGDVRRRLQGAARAPRPQRAELGPDHADDDDDPGDPLGDGRDARARRQRGRVRRGRRLLRGVFRCTDGLQAKYGTSRGFDAPIAEGGIVGAAIGMGAYGLRPVAEIQFRRLHVSPRYDQIVSGAARLRYRSAGDFTAPITIRMRAAAHLRRADAQPEPEALFTHVCGLRTVMPSNPYDAKGLLIASIECDDPVIFLEPKRIYNGPFDATTSGRSCRGRTPARRGPEGHYTVRSNPRRCFGPGARSPS